jgi:carbon-monoxide dehydrogenase medium subunit
MYAFTYRRPTTVRQAAGLLAKNDDAKLLAGGHTLIPTMKLRLAGPPQIIDMSKIEGLSGIELKGRSLVIGAMTRHAEVATSPIVQEAIPALAGLAGRIGDPAVRHRGTIGGSIANNDPAADYPAAVLALGATIKTNKRSIAADDFFKGLFATALTEGEIITQVAFPIPAKAGYSKFPHPASRFALTGVFVVKTKSGDVRVAATGASQSGVMRVPAIEAALKANWSASALDNVKISDAGLMSDLHGASDYRANLIKVMAQRAVTEAG